MVPSLVSGLRQKDCQKRLDTSTDSAKINQTERENIMLNFNVGRSFFFRWSPDHDSLNLLAAKPPLCYY